MRLSLACLTFVTMILCASAPLHAQPTINEVICFGASFSDNGNGHILSYGIAAAPPYFGGRFSNGPLWVERLAERLGLGTPTEEQAVPAPSEAGGTDYAYAGASTESGYSDSCVRIDGNKICTPNVGLQIELFFEDDRVLDGDELIIIQGGGNDDSPVRAAMNVADHIRTLAAAGGKVFMIPNLFRLRSPAAEGTWSEKARDNFAEHYDIALQIELALVEAELDVTILRLDLLGVSDHILAYPEDYGLTNVTDPACPGCGAGIPGPGAADTVVENPEEYLYWDWIHFAATAHRIFGDAAADLVLE